MSQPFTPHWELVIEVVMSAVLTTYITLVTTGLIILDNMYPLQSRIRETWTHPNSSFSRISWIIRKESLFFLIPSYVTKYVIPYIVFHSRNTHLCVEPMFKKKREKWLCIIKTLRYSMFWGKGYWFYPLSPQSLKLPSRWSTFEFWYMAPYMGFHICSLEYSWSVLDHPLWSDYLIVFYFLDQYFYQLTFFYVDILTSNWLRFQLVQSYISQTLGVQGIFCWLYGI